MHLNIISFVQNRRNEPFAVRMLVTINLIAVLVTVSTIIGHVLIKHQIHSTDFLCSGIFILSLIFSELALRPKFTAIIHKLTVGLYAFLYIPLGFIIVGTITLPISTYLFFIILLLNFLATRKELYIVNPFIFIYVTVFIYIEYIFPEHLPPMPRNEEVLLCWIIIMPVMMIASMLIAAIIIESFKRERKELERQQELLQQKNIELKEQTRIDSLTGLYNKEYLNEQLTKYINLSRREHFPLSVIVADIDFFKNYNDYYGHIQGDSCLKQVAELLKVGAGRTSDYVFRFGGEEFVLLLPSADETGSMDVAERIIQSINNQHIEHNKSEICGHITISMGIATYNGEENMTSDALIRVADKALYRMKQSGRNGYSIAH